MGSSSNNNPKELNKDFYLVLNNSSVINKNCENCNNEAIGLFKIAYYTVLNEKECQFNRKEELKNLCQNCYLLLKKEEKLPKFLEPIYSFLFKENLNVEELDLITRKIKENPLNLEGNLLNYCKEEVHVLDEKDDLSKLEALPLTKKTLYIRDFLFKYFFGESNRKFLYDEEDDELYLIVNEHYLRRVKSNLKEIFKHLFPNLVSSRFYEEFFNALNDYIITIKKELRSKKIDNEYFIPFKDMVFDRRTLDECKEEVYFTDQYPYRIREFLNMLKEYAQKVMNKEITIEQFFKEIDSTLIDFLPYRTIRRFYLDDKKWITLLKTIGSLLSTKNDKNRVRATFIKGEPRTGKTTLLDLIAETLKGRIRKISWYDLDPKNLHRFSFLHKQKPLAYLIEEDPHVSVFNPVIFKEYIGAGRLSIRPLYHDSEEVRTKPKLLIFVNKLPIFKELDRAFMEKLNVIEPSNPLSKDEIDPLLEEKLFREESLEQFFKIMLFGLFLFELDPKIPQDMAKIESLMIEGEDRFYIKEFIEQLPKGSNLQIERKELFKEYEKWFNLHHRGERKARRNTFYDIVEKYGYQVKEDRKGIRYFQGIDLPKPNKSQDSLI